MRTVYLDNAATTPISKEVVDAMYECMLQDWYNPDSMYKPATTIKKKVEDVREKIAKTLKCMSNEIYFTSGGSEANTWAIKGVCEAYKHKGKHIITSKVEHHSVLNACKQLEKYGYRVTYLDVCDDGTVDLYDLEQAICDDTILISIMAVNNELGCLNNIRQIGEIAEKHDIVFHSDFVQYYPHISNINISEYKVDLVSVSGHKFGASKGVGFLYKRNGIMVRPLICGGKQERGFRGGTTNVAGVLGMGVALDNKHKEIYEQYGDLCYRFVHGLFNAIGEDNVRLNCVNSGSIASIEFIGVDGEAFANLLALNGIYCSAGSACTTGDPKPSHVLKAIGLSDTQAKSTLRFSIGYSTTEDDIDYAVNMIRTCYNMMF